MNIVNIFTKNRDTLPEGRADFLLATSVTKTSEIEGITPTLDAEFITNEKFFSMQEVANTPNNLPTRALITRAVHNLNPFSSIEVLDLGLSLKPEATTLHDFGINPLDAINTNVKIDAKEIFKKGMSFGRAYELKGNYLILGESRPSGTTTATATALALGYDCNDVKNKTVNETLALLHDNMSNFEKLSIVSDNMLIFCAGFLLEATRRFHVVLAGATEMAVCLLIADKLREDVLMQLKSNNLTLATTELVAQDKNSNLKHILEQLSYKPHAIYTTFSFADAEIPILKKYDEGEVKDGVGSGASLAYGATNNLTNKEVLDSLELIIYMM